jgi:lipopolysaccharide biosynthesis regulator YciM
MSNLKSELYTSKVSLALYSLARMYFTSGFESEAEKICLSILTISESASPSRLLLAAIHLEKGNYSLAANHYRIASQDGRYSLIAKFGLLACYSGLKDYSRAQMLSEEIEKEKHSFSEEQNVLFSMFQTSIAHHTKK